MRYKVIVNSPFYCETLEVSVSAETQSDARKQVRKYMATYSPIKEVMPLPNVLDVDINDKPKRIHVRNISHL